MNDEVKQFVLDKYSLILENKMPKSAIIKIRDHCYGAVDFVAQTTKDETVRQWWNDEMWNRFEALME